MKKETENKKAENRNLTKEEFEEYRQKLSMKNNPYNEQDNRNKFFQQRHLYDHKMKKESSIINITDKNLQIEYETEVNYILKNLFIFILLSIISIIQVILILRNYRNYDEVILSLIFSCFTFFISFFLIVEIFREGLKDQLRHSLFRLFAIFFFIFCICYYVSGLRNIYIIYNKIKLRKEKCEQDTNFCNDNRDNNIIMVLSGLIIITLIIFGIFPIKIGIRSIKILLGYDMDVLQKQILEYQKVNKNNKKKPAEDKNVHQKIE